MKAYNKLEAKFQKIAHVNSILSTLSWDRAVMMPENGEGNRAEEMAFLNVMKHAEITSNEISDLVAEANQDSQDLNQWQLANLKEMGRQYNHASAMNSELISKISRRMASCEFLWRRAKAENNFKIVEEEFAVLVDLIKEKANVKSERLGLCPYNSLVDRYSPYIGTKEIDVLFDDYMEFYPNFLNQVMEHKSQQELLPLDGSFPIYAQEKLNKKVAEILGFNFKSGRIDSSAHPFSTGLPGDLRITTKYNEEDFIWGVGATMHEVGHSLYDGNGSPEWHGQPVGINNNMGMMIHESQSLTLDMIIGRSPEITKFLAPIYKQAFNLKGNQWNHQNIYNYMTKVERAGSRLDADEVSYSAHLVLRYNLEKRIIMGKLDVKDIPDAWAAEMEKIFGITPRSVKESCLQDIHWYDGSFGYFPSYALGQMTSCQFFAKAQQDLPNLMDNVEKGDLSGFNNWSKTNIHQKGCLYTPTELVKNVTGEELNIKYLKDHLRKRYLG